MKKATSQLRTCCLTLKLEEGGAGRRKCVIKAFPTSSFEDILLKWRRLKTSSRICGRDE